MKYRFKGAYACICVGLLWEPGQEQDAPEPIDNPMFEPVAEPKRSKNTEEVTEEKTDG